MPRDVYEKLDHRQKLRYELFMGVLDWQTHIATTLEFAQALFMGEHWLFPPGLRDEIEAMEDEPD